MRPELDQPEDPTLARRNAVTRRIVEHGEESEEEATEEEAAKGAPLAGGESLGIGSLRGSMT